MQGDNSDDSTKKNKYSNKKRDTTSKVYKIAGWLPKTVSEETFRRRIRITKKIVYFPVNLTKKIVGIGRGLMGKGKSSSNRNNRDK